jgi:hypothetical protein
LSLATLVEGAHKYRRAIGARMENLFAFTSRCETLPMFVSFDLVSKKHGICYVWSNPSKNMIYCIFKIIENIPNCPIAFGSIRSG